MSWTLTRGAPARRPERRKSDDTEEVAYAGWWASGPDHAAAADLLARVDAKLGKRLADLVELKPASHYGSKILDDDDRTKALRHAAALVKEARARTA